MCCDSLDDCCWLSQCWPPIPIPTKIMFISKDQLSCWVQCLYTKAVQDLDVNAFDGSLIHALQRLKSREQPIHLS